MSNIVYNHRLIYKTKFKEIPVIMKEETDTLPNENNTSATLNKIDHQILRGSDVEDTDISHNKTNNNFFKIHQSTFETNRLYKYLLTTVKKQELARIYIVTTINNSFLTYNLNNKVITKSIRSLGFKGKAKNTTYAYKLFIKTFVNKIKLINNSLLVDLYVKPLNSKLKIFLTKFKLYNITINKIYDITPLPYNGCRTKKLVIKKKRKSLVKYLSYIS